MRSSLFARGDAAWLRLEGRGQVWIEEPLLQRLRVVVEDGLLECRLTREWEVVDECQARGRLGEIAVERRFLSGEGFLEERIRLRNEGPRPVRIDSAIFGVQRKVINDIGMIEPAHAQDRLVPIPFRRCPWDERLQDRTVADLAREPGRETRRGEWGRFAYLPHWQHRAEGWAWERDGRCLAVLTGNDTAMQYGALAPLPDADGMWVGIGAGLPGCGEPGECAVLEPGEELDCGRVRYVCLEGGFMEAMLAYRGWLDERGRRFPSDYNPPLQWNELYDNPEWTMTTGAPVEGGRSSRETRAQVYTRAAMEEEAAKAHAHGCEALYLDPGWDTSFGSFIWAEDRLGPMRQFVDEMRERYGLAVSLHCPVAPWMSQTAASSAAAGFPETARRLDADGSPIDSSLICLSSRQYLDEAERRLLKLCEDGAAFLMLDGTTWTGTCHNPDHGHPVPVTYADHIDANFELARRIKARHPHVLIEMHDPISGGSRRRWTPVYHGYDPERYYDENWGFELMWDPFEDLSSGRARALYYYALSCNVPAYLHIDLRDDNEHATSFWWYASTCRHLGVGGTHENPNVVNVHRHAARRYRELERFFKVGEFYGMGEEIHVHVLPDEDALVVNLFNLSDEPRRLEARRPLAGLGIDPTAWFTRRPNGVSMSADTGELVVACSLPPWGNRVCELRAVADRGR